MMKIKVVLWIPVVIFKPVFFFFPLVKIHIKENLSDHISSCRNNLSGYTDVKINKKNKNIYQSINQ